MHTEAGSLLVEAGLITEEQLQEVLGTVVQYGGTVIQNVIRLGIADDEELAAFLAEKLRLPKAESGQFENLPAFITRLVPEDLVLAHRLVPIMLHQGVVHVAMTDPTDRAGLEEISFQTGYQASPVVASYGLVEKAMARYYKIPPEEHIIPSREPGVPETPAAQLARSGVEEEKPDQQPGEPVRQSPPGSIDAFDQGPPTQPPEPSEGWQMAAPDSGILSPAGSGETTDDARPRLEVVENGSAELEELFFGLGREDGEIVHLTNVKGGDTASAGTIADAIRDQAQDSLQQHGVQRQEPATTGVEFEPLRDGEQARNMISQAGDRDQVAKVLIRFALGFLPRAALFIVKKDILVGWMGGGEGISANLVKGIMIPLESPSVFKTVRETETDYFGSLPKTTVNDIFISALGETRPSRVLLIPITVRHKPICIFYGDCGKEAGFSNDLSPIHLLIADVSRAFERIILRRKMGRRIVR